MKHNCPDCGGRVAAITAGPVMQVRCFGQAETWQDQGCGAAWLHSEWNSVAWANFKANLRVTANAVS